MNNTEIRLFVGDPVTNTAELNLINRLRSDLARHGISGTLYANFFTEARQSLQIDLLVRTESRTAHVEIKGFSAEHPIRGYRNGNWAQVLPGGKERTLGKNCGRQALSGTYTISDAMRSLAQAGVVTSAEGGFFRYIDSIVGIWERVPSGSDIDPPPHVTVTGYQELLERLRQPGPVVPWSDEEWDEFARHHSLFQLEETSPAEARRRDATAIVDDYRIRSRASLSNGLSPFISLEVSGPDVSSSDADGIGRWVADGRSAAVVGPSGSGKSFLARHLAVRHCDEGRMVIWIQASDYTMGEFRALLARALGSFSIERRSDLVDAASDAGVPLTVVVDGLNECPSKERDELLRQLQAFTLRHPAGMLITSTTQEGLGGTGPVDVFRLHEPDESTRVAILSSHGTRRPDLISSQFRIPHDLAIAAQCANEIGDSATVADLHDAFIRKHVPTEHLRAGLRALASHLHTTLRSSVALMEAVKVLSSPNLGLSAEQMDAVFGTALLKVNGHRIRFRHDLFGQHLAAEALVLASESGQGLGATLSVPANRALIPAALGIEKDGVQTWAALYELADPSLVAASLLGTYGPEMAQRAKDIVREALRAGIADTATGNASIRSIEPGTLKGVQEGFGHWATSGRRTESDQVLLVASGIALEMFIDEACELIDLTDELCQAQARRLKAEGIADAEHAVIRPTYSSTVFLARSGEELAATLLVRGLRESARFSPRSCEGKPRELARRFAEEAGPRSWGRYFAAILSIVPDDLDDQALVASLLKRAWDAGNLDLRLEALDMVRRIRCHAEIGEPHRSEIGRTLLSLEPGKFLAEHYRLDEELSAFGQIDNTTDSGRLRDEIRADIASSFNIDTARRIAAMQYDNQDICGPYREAIDGLEDREKAQLLATAASGDTRHTVFINLMIAQLVDIVPTGDHAIDETARAVFATHMICPHEDAFMEHEAIGAYLYAIRGWAKFERALPSQAGDPGSHRTSWHLLAGLQLRYERDDAQVDAAQTWDALLADPSRTAVTLTLIDHSDSKHEFDEGHQLVRRRTLPDRLASDYPKPMRQLLRWVLENPSEVALDVYKQRRVVAFAIRTLGETGDESSAKILHPYTLDPETGDIAVEAIRQIHNRAAS